MRGFGRELERFLRDQHNRGFIRKWRVETVLLDHSVRLDIWMNGNGRLGFAITESELAMGGERALRYWMQEIEREIERYIRPNPDAIRLHNCYQREDQWREMAQLIQSNSIGMSPTSYFARQFLQDFDGWKLVDPKADSRAKDLFKMACGAEAFETLNSGKPLPLTGSKGTKYTLHNRATYCIERVKDGAKLCAVVPSVPRWDHLLGIKLMVENDEAAFLKTANVSGAAIHNWAG